MMQLTLERLSSGSESTIGALFIDGNFACFTCEDQHQDVKVMHETRIPAGTYKIKLRPEGGFHMRYKRKFGDRHRGMLWLQDVPKFEWVLIHIGNDDDDTSGCILVGRVASSEAGGGGTVGNSTNAYWQFYPSVAGALELGDDVQITIRDRD
jgi:hypothetical protein